MELDEETKKRIKRMLMEKRKEFEEKLAKARETFNEEIRARDKATKKHLGDYNNRFYIGDDRLNTLIKCLRKIDEAMERVDQGIYGICQKCGQQIPLGRLMAVPWTEHCVPCKNLSNGRVGAVS